MLFNTRMGGATKALRANLEKGMIHFSSSSYLNGATFRSNDLELNIDLRIDACTRTGFRR